MKPLFPTCAAVIFLSTCAAMAGSVGGSAFSMGTGETVQNTTSGSGSFEFDFDEVVKSGTTKSFPDNGALAGGTAQGGLMGGDLFGDPAKGLNTMEATDLPKFGADF